MPHPYKVRIGTSPRGIRFAIPLPSGNSPLQMTHYKGIEKLDGETGDG
jgi:hypothetical protein